MKACSVLVILLMMFPTVRAEGPAGIVLYFRDGAGAVYLLLADDARATRGWSAFGGGADAGEAAVETAARETEEETRGYFRRDWLAERIREREPVRSNGYTMFFAEVPYVPARRVENHPVPGEAPDALRERPHYAWIPWTDIERAIRENDLGMDRLYLPPSSRNASYWEVWIANMRDAQRKGALPWEKAAKGVAPAGTP